MHPSNLPNNAKVTAEGDSTMYCPNGMLDPEQRTTFRIVKFKKNSTQTVDNRQASTAHFNQNNAADGTTSTDISEKCKKDNNETVMSVLTKNLQKFDFNRSRTKLPVAYLVIAWITIFIAYSKAGPIQTLSPTNYFDCTQNMSKTSTYNYSILIAVNYNINTTIYSLQELKAQLSAYQGSTRTSNETVASWHHKSEKISKISNKTLSEMFAGPNFLEKFQESLENMYNRISEIRELLNFHLCRHTNRNYTDQTLHNMSLDQTTNANIVKQLGHIRSYTSSSINMLNDTLRDLGFKTHSEQIIVNCTLKSSTTKHSEIITMKELEGTLKLMSKIFNYIKTKVCLQT